MQRKRLWILFLWIYGPFKNISPMSSQSFSKGGRKLELPGKQPDHLYAELGLLKCASGTNPQWWNTWCLRIKALNLKATGALFFCVIPNTDISNHPLKSMNFLVLKIYFEITVNWGNRRWNLKRIENVLHFLFFLNFSSCYLKVKKMYSIFYILFKFQLLLPQSKENVFHFLYSF